MITLRSANLGDLKVLSLWDQQEHVIASDPNDDWNWEVELQKTHEWRRQLIAEENNVPIGFIQIIDPSQEESHYWGNMEKGYRAIDIWIGLKENLGKGYGSEMMRQAIERCFASPEVKAILVDPLTTNVRAHKFYKSLGFRFVEERIFENDLCHVYQLDRKNI